MNRSILTLGLAVMDLCWLYPWAALLGEGAVDGETILVRVGAHRRPHYFASLSEVNGSRLAP